jgi:hypothetical protein
VGSGADWKIACTTAAGQAPTPHFPLCAVLRSGAVANAAADKGLPVDSVTEVPVTLLPK